MALCGLWLVATAESTTGQVACGILALPGVLIALNVPPYGGRRQKNIGPFR